MENKKIIISLGGSLIVPDEIDIPFIKLFTETILEYTKKGFRFSIITGGGKICRKYNTVAGELITPAKDDLDWLGIATTRLNAEVIRISFGQYAYGSIILNPNNIPITDKPITVGGGEKPGSSSDLAAVQSAISLGSKKVINLSNIDYAYDKDPNKYPDAKKLENISWAEYRELIPKEWQPGLSSPFDPIASEQAQLQGITVTILNGRNIENLKNYLDGKDFIGTTIQ